MEWGYSKSAIVRAKNIYPCLSCIKFTSKFSSKWEFLPRGIQANKYKWKNKLWNILQFLREEWNEAAIINGHCSHRKGHGKGGQGKTSSLVWNTQTLQVHKPEVTAASLKNLVSENENFTDSQLNYQSAGNAEWRKTDEGLARQPLAKTRIWNILKEKRLLSSQ